VSKNLVWRSLLVIAVLGVSMALVLDRPIKLGLDLRGGTQIVLEAQELEQQAPGADALDRTLEVLRRRVDQLGVAEPSLQTSGEDRIIIELPGVTDPDEALEVIGRTAQLKFHAVEGVVEEPRENRQNADGQGTDPLVLPDEQGQELRLAPSELTGESVGDAQAVIDTQAGALWQVTISFRGDGADTWAQLTGAAACAPPGSPERRVAIILDQEIISSPEVGTEVECDRGITGGDTVITGNFTDEEAKDLALLIRAGALPVPVEVIEQRTIGPTLGRAAVDASIEAALIGGALTMLYVIAYYRVLGLLAGLALLSYGLVSFAVLLALQATLTLPGIAGFVLAIGMAVDANVLVFERAKEEFTAGRRARNAVTQGFKKAWTAIADSNATTVIAAIILFYFASGAVRGFGITLTVGVAVSMFTALVVTRLFVELALKSRSLAEHPRPLGLTVGRRLRTFFVQKRVDIMSRSKLWFAISTALVALSVVGLGVQGLNFGLEFTGGRLLEYTTTEPVAPDDMRTELASLGFPRAIAQTSGDGNIAIRSAELTDEEEGRVERSVIRLGGSAERVRDEFVGPTIGAELRRNALIALGLGLTAQLLYLAFRFRWTFGSAAVLALFHDVLILLGIFAWLGKDIDGVFVAALLTVIGYSINDSVVVFDRIREQRRLRSKDDVAEIANDACLQTIPRTINTGLGALFILLALYFLGGETLTDFALALIVGILIGTYSSIFTAAPLVVLFERRSSMESSSYVGAGDPVPTAMRPTTTATGSTRVEAPPRQSKTSPSRKKKKRKHGRR
jgi:SecD/SecF fusion protein